MTTNYSLPTASCSIIPRICSPYLLIWFFSPPNLLPTSAHFSVCLSLLFTYTPFSPYPFLELTYLVSLPWCSVPSFHIEFFMIFFSLHYSFRLSSLGRFIFKNNISGSWMWGSQGRKPLFFLPWEKQNLTFLLKDHTEKYHNKKSVDFVFCFSQHVFQNLCRQSVKELNSGLAEASVKDE